MKSLDKYTRLTIYINLFVCDSVCVPEEQVIHITCSWRVVGRSLSDRLGRIGEVTCVLVSVYSTSGGFNLFCIRLWLGSTLTFYLFEFYHVLLFHICLLLS